MIADTASYATGGDTYTFQATVGDQFDITTTTPADGFVNLLDPSITLYGPSGDKVATNANGNPDGLNALLHYTATSSGPYTVRIQGIGSSGEYTLSLSAIHATTPPATSATLAGTVGVNGWYQGGVQVTLSGADATSGVAGTYYAVDGGGTQSYTRGVHGERRQGAQRDVLQRGQRGERGGPADGGGGHRRHAAGDERFVLGAGGVQRLVRGQRAGDADGERRHVGRWRRRITRWTAGARRTYAAPFAVSSNGTHAVTYYSVDRAGNVESGNTLAVDIDSVAPVSSDVLTGTLGNGWYTSSVQVTLTASDATSGVAGTYYAVDGGSTAAYGAPFSVSSNGAHAVTFYSVDRAGNVEQRETASFAIDAALPVTSSVLAGPAGSNGWYRGGVQVTLTASAVSGVAGTYYAVDGGGTQSYAGPLSFSGDGTHAVTYYSVDKAGNVESPKTVDVDIDGTPPATSRVLGGPSTPARAGITPPCR